MATKKRRRKTLKIRKSSPRQRTPKSKSKLAAKRSRHKIVRHRKLARHSGSAKIVRQTHGKKLMLNPDFEFFYELRDLILKSSPAEKGKMISKIAGLGRIKLAIISGLFLNRSNEHSEAADLLMVGDDINRRKLNIFLKSLEAEVGGEIKFTLMDKEEFRYRLAMFDRFVRVLLEGPHEKLINKLGI